MVFVAREFWFSIYCVCGGGGWVLYVLCSLYAVFTALNGSVYLLTVLERLIDMELIPIHIGTLTNTRCW